jgi:hypothetical protein
MNNRAALLVIGIFVLGNVAAADGPALARQSPFCRGVAGESDVQGTPSLELRGIMSTPEGTLYCIYDPGKKSSVWASADDTGNAFLVKSGKPSLDEVTLDVEGRAVTLRLRNAKVIPSLAEQAAAPQAVGLATMPAAAPILRRQPGEPRAPREKPVQ